MMLGEIYRTKFCALDVSSVIDPKVLVEWNALFVSSAVAHLEEDDFPISYTVLTILTL